MRLFGRAAARVRFEPLETGDAEACAALHGSAFAHGWSALEFERLITGRGSRGEAAHAAGATLAGFVLSRAAAGEAEILTIAVRRAQQRHGLGRALLDRHLSRLAEHGVRELFLEVGEDNVPARRLYAAAGFAEVGRRPAYYRAVEGVPPRSALVLRRALG